MAYHYISSAFSVGPMKFVPFPSMNQILSKKGNKNPCTGMKDFFFFLKCLLAKKNKTCSFVRLPIVNDKKKKLLDSLSQEKTPGQTTGPKSL